MLEESASHKNLPAQTPYASGVRFTLCLLCTRNAGNKYLDRYFIASSGESLPDIRVLIVLGGSVHRPERPSPEITPPADASAFADCVTSLPRAVRQ